jgi:polyphosphate kinase
METSDPRLFINRELSWLAFDERVLDEAKDGALPVYERVKFLGIVASNLDEFFMVRVAGLKQQVLGGVVETRADGLSPADQLAAIRERAKDMVSEQYRIWREEILPLLSSTGVAILTRDALSPEQVESARQYFFSHVFPALTPLAVDQGHPFPHLRNKSHNLAVLLRKEAKGRKRRKESPESSLAVVQVPSVLRRLVPLPVAKGLGFLLLEELISMHVGELFAGYTPERTAAFRVTRNWDLDVDEEESEDLLSSVQDELRRRDRGAAVRLELQPTAPENLEQFLTAALHLSPTDVYRVDGPLQLSDLSALSDVDLRPELRVEALVPSIPSRVRDSESMLQTIRNGDLLLHHPYDSFDPVVRFIEEAAEDPDVLAIKQTLYRTSADSPVARALSRAVEYGKQVAVLVEIRARLDEANNISWARRMEEAGVHVVYGLVGLKTHCKVALVARREANGIRRYVHLGTGNYNPHTARQYTDVSLFTARDDIGEDASALFNVLTGYASNPHWKRFSVAPFDLRDRVIALIEKEADQARRKEPASIVAKLNALVDPKVIQALYRASQAGVNIHLIVRGICCLRPGIEGVSERIQVTSVVDRFLEHSRVFVFGEGARQEVYLSSADWMPRNFIRRVEVMFPVDDSGARARLLDEVLGASLRDNVKAKRLLVDGSYVSVAASEPSFRSQVALLDIARRNENHERSPPTIRHIASPGASVEAARLGSVTAIPPRPSSPTSNRERGPTLGP